jgi:hypothetical protein
MNRPNVTNTWALEQRALDRFHGLEHAALDEEFEEVRSGLKFDVFDG